MKRLLTLSVLMLATSALVGSLGSMDNASALTTSFEGFLAGAEFGETSPGTFSDHYMYEQ